MRAVAGSRTLASTLHLPRSTFRSRPWPIEQAALLPKCTDELYEWQRRHRPPHKTFLLHDGPPYANGSLHVGHALNKILKDAICRFELAQGHRVDYVPGWDCHGLPIELKALQDNPQVAREREPAAVRQAARTLARGTVQAQTDEFKQWAIMADWGAAWTTMDKDYELRQLRLFRNMVEHGLIYRRVKPVYWSPYAATALAEAELEYKDDHESTAALVSFDLAHPPAPLARMPGVDPARLAALVWTTTPWTLPGNKAIAVNSNLTYAVLDWPDRGQFLVAEACIPRVAELCPSMPITPAVESIPGSDLVGSGLYNNPFQREGAPANPIIHADFVSDESGSGLVHCAPGHGLDDFEVCDKLGITPFTPVDSQGRFEKEAMPASPELLAGQFVLTRGAKSVLDILEKRGAVLRTHKYRHKYPYDWRSKRPVIVRATEQWFANVEDIKEKALGSLEQVEFIPESSKSRLVSFIKGRNEWCISRQRAWGVPIPALYHQQSGSALLTRASVDHIISVIEERGIDAWWTDRDDEPTWTPPELRDDSGKTVYKRGTDTMDVWLDSGSSWMQISGHEGESLADVYIEGTDQHRGWFQSSLLTYIAHCVSSHPPLSSSAAAPFKTLITHGFTLDERKRKMSKSIGNVVSPGQVIDGSYLHGSTPSLKNSNQGRLHARKGSMGPDALRLWVACSDYTHDVVVGRPALEAADRKLHKLRTTIMFLLGVLTDFTPASAVRYNALGSMDKMALLQLAETNSLVVEAFKRYEFYKGLAAAFRWLNTDLSALYIDGIKDRIYAEPAVSSTRRSAQTVLYHVLNHLLGLIGPITPLLVEEAWHHMPAGLKGDSLHPLRRPFPTSRPEWDNAQLVTDLPVLLAAKEAVNAAQEQARAAKRLGSSLQCTVVLAFPSLSDSQSSATYNMFKPYAEELEALFVVSAVRLTRWSFNLADHVAWMYSAPFDTLAGVNAKAYVLPSGLAKCIRCWRYTAAPIAEPGLAVCARCDEVLESLDVSPRGTLDTDEVHSQAAKAA
ncbi:MAG: isoleucine-tRNA ligase [Piccolia ochrophora]|nr:MAG: isoleucine-tRNA ligase [Piccolia ochrophora]